MATTSGASQRTRIASMRCSSLRTIARQVSAGCQSGAVCAQRVKPGDQGIEFGEQFQLGQFVARHGGRKQDKG